MPQPCPGLVALCGLVLLQPAGAIAYQPQAQVLATQALDVKPRPGNGPRTARPAGSAGREQSAPTAGRGSSPVDIVSASGPAQPGYVHYFLLTLPDESLETLVGIELPGRMIAWSFPGLGVVALPFIEKGVVTAGGSEYVVSHLYGIRPFPDAAAMDALRKEIFSRVDRWVSAGTPYCDNDGPRSTCMSCLGFVLRVLFPGRRSDYPELPADFRRALYPKSYSTEDLVLYLTGMMDLPTREARMKRLAQLDLPEALREEVLELVVTMDTAETGAAPAAAKTAVNKDPASRSPKVSTRPAQRKRLLEYLTK